MANAVAVTRNGLGDFWLFTSAADADLHPIVQYGDVICDGPGSILRQYNRLEMPDLLRRLGDESLRSEILIKAGGPSGWSETMSRYAPRMWEMMQNIASPPPSNPAEIVSVIVRDRRLSIVESTGREKERKMSDTAEKTETTEKIEKTKKQPDTVGGYSLSAKITLLVDKNGVKYGKENNPKKPGSATHARFANYADGQTVEEAYKAGVAAGDFSYDVSKGFISIS